MGLWTHLDPEVSGRTIEVVERVSHAPGLGSPELRVQRLDLLQFGVDRCCLARQGHEGRVLRLER